MYMSYYKHPELKLLSEDAVQTITAQERDKFFLSFASESVSVYGGGTRHLGDEEERQGAEWFYGKVDYLMREGRLYDKIDNTYYISETFWQAMYKSFDKLMPIIEQDDVLRSVHENCCIVCRYWTMFFWRQPDEDGSDIYYLLIFNDSVLLHISAFKVGQNGVTSTKTYTFEDLSDYGDDDMSFIMSGYSFLLFKKYGNVDIETVAAKKTLRKSQILGEKVNNFMGIDVQVLDSRWFTTICRDEGFLVSGHFRLQPCKDEQGEWTRKLIYINPYAKHGYHRLAPIVNINNE